MFEPNALDLSPTEGFVETPKVKEIVDRALMYLRLGFAVHFSGPTGTGKTTLAMHLAAQYGQPVMLIFGDEEYTTSDLVGAEHGYRYKRVVDRFISSVLKVEENMTKSWVDNRLTAAVKDGHTLIYDEFNRSRPEANNVLLSVLEEGILTLPPASDNGSFLKVHPNFRAIFTSNPEEYAGVHKSQDALRDRMVTIHLDYFDQDTEAAIVRARSGISHYDAARIIKLLRALRAENSGGGMVTIRPGIIIGKALKELGLRADGSDPLFAQVVHDAITSGQHRFPRAEFEESVSKLLKEYCSRPLSPFRKGVKLGQK